MPCIPECKLVMFSFSHFNLIQLIFKMFNRCHFCIECSLPPTDGEIPETDLTGQGVYEAPIHRKEESLQRPRRSVKRFPNCNTKDEVFNVSLNE